jgi:hemerythrin-like domain-containing protein
MSHCRNESMKTTWHPLNHDHERLDELFFQFRELMETNRTKARKAFRDFNSGLREHIKFEEQTLFPLYEEKFALSEEGPTDVMRLEHRIIRQLLVELDRKLESAASDGSAEQIVFLELLRNHNTREESAIYLKLDKLSQGKCKAKQC